MSNAGFIFIIYENLYKAIGDKQHRHRMEQALQNRRHPYDSRQTFRRSDQIMNRERIAVLVEALKQVNIYMQNRTSIFTLCVCIYIYTHSIYVKKINPKWIPDLKSKPKFSSKTQEKIFVTLEQAKMPQIELKKHKNS